MRRVLRQVHGTRGTRRTIAVAPARQLDAQINVTPLIDVVLVLLIIFMVVTPVAERELGALLSQSRRTTALSDVAPTQVLVAIDGSDTMRVNAQPVARAAYVSHLRQLLAGRRAEDAVVFVVAGDDASYAQLVEAIDRAKEAGAASVGLAPDRAD